MMGVPLRSLIVEDVLDDALILVRQLRRGGYDVTFRRVDSAAAYMAALECETWDIILADYTLPSFGGLEALGIYNEKGLDMPLIIVSGTIGEEVAVEAMKAGAHDYVMKGNLQRLLPAIQRELREADIRREQKREQAEHRTMIRRQQEINVLQQALLAPARLEDRLRTVTETIVRLLDVDFCRIWLIRPGDLCQEGCIHAEVKQGPHVCRHRDRCLHLLASAGRYTHTDGRGHRRVPLGCYKIGRIASGQDHKFLTNNVQDDPRVHNHDWARELGLMSFAGYQLRVSGGETLGVLALFAKHPISVEEDAILDGLGSTVALTARQAIAQDALQQSEMKFRTLHDSSGDAIMVLDEKGFLDCNSATLRIFGCASKEEFCCKHPSDLSPPEQPCGADSMTLANEKVALAMERGSNHFEWVHKRVKTDEVFPADVMLSRMALNGKRVLQAIVRDITERKDAEERLRFQADVLSQIKDAVIAVDERFQITYVNSAAALLYDIDGEAEGQNLKDICGVRWLKAEDEASFNDGLATQGLWHGHAAHIKSSGQEVFVELSASILRGTGGGGRGLLLIVRDATEQRAAEDALKESHRLLSTLLGNLPGMVYRCCNDQDRTMEYLSSGCESLTGFAAEDLIGNKRQSYASLIHPHDVEQVRRQLQQALESEETYRLTYRIVTQSGADKWVWEQGWIESGGQQGKVVLEGLILDISEQKAEEERRVRLMTAVEQAAEAIVITNTEGTMEYVNPAFTEITGYTREEAVGRNPRILRSGRHDLAFYRDLWDTLLRGQTWKGRIVNKRKDGSLLEEEATISPVRDTHGKITNYVAVKRDVTQIMALETQLRQAQKLEAVGSLAAGIAHEINTPIQFVGDNTHFLSEAFTQLLVLVEKGIALAGTAPAATGDQPSPCHDFLRAVDGVDFPYLQQEIPHAIEQTLQGVDRVATIVRALKEFSHPDKGEKTPIDINKALQTTLTVARNEIKYVADVETAFAENLPLVFCHPGALNQVFLNLLVNAAHAIAGVSGDGSGGRGKITVATRIDGEDVVVAISDTGTGIKEEIRDRIFDPFFTTKDVGKGTGQGLAIARSVVVEKHGGSLTFETAEGKGTTFLVRLPMVNQGCSLGKAA